MNSGFPLAVPYYSQRDSKSGHSHRMCFSSSCAMVLQYLRPGTLKGSNGDDQYLQTVFKFGDTIYADNQMKALREYGIYAHHSQSVTLEDIDKILTRYRLPVVPGILHKGHVNRPYGGHRLVIIGITDDGQNYIVHDPYGELDLFGGTYLNTNGKARVYSKKNFSKRFLDKTGHGWALYPDKKHAPIDAPKKDPSKINVNYEFLNESRQEFRKDGHTFIDISILKNLGCNYEYDENTDTVNVFKR